MCVYVKITLVRVAWLIGGAGLITELNGYKKNSPASGRPDAGEWIVLMKSLCGDSQAARSNLN